MPFKLQNFVEEIYTIILKGRTIRIIKIEYQLYLAAEKSTKTKILSSRVTVSKEAYKLGTH